MLLVCFSCCIKVTRLFSELCCASGVCGEISCKWSNAFPVFLFVKKKSPNFSHSPDRDRPNQKVGRKIFQFWQSFQKPFKVGVTKFPRVNTFCSLIRLSRTKPYFLYMRCAPPALLGGLPVGASWGRPGGGNSFRRQQNKEATSLQSTFLLSFSLLGFWLEPKWRPLLLQEALESCFVLLSPWFSFCSPFVLLLFCFVLLLFSFCSAFVFLCVESLGQVSLVFPPFCFLSLWF